MAERRRPRAASRAGRRFARVLLAGAMLGVLAGCESQLVLKADDADRGLVIVLPGIDGRMPYNEIAARHLAEQDIRMAVELRDWTAPLGMLYNQTAVMRNREVAQTVAARIEAYRREHPGRPVFLIGHSGGTALAVWAAEALPADEPVDGIILLASSLSPTYDLSAALARSRGGIVSFYSPLDGGLLGIGTTLVGTMDGLHGESAGKVGFHRPGESGGSDPYPRLYQVAWDPKMIAAGHGGGHFDYMSLGFVSTYIAPLIRASAWDRQVAQLSRL